MNFTNLTKQFIIKIILTITNDTVLYYSIQMYYQMYVLTNFTFRVLEPPFGGRKGSLMATCFLKSVEKFVVDFLLMKIKLLSIDVMSRHHDHEQKLRGNQCVCAKMVAFRQQISSFTHLSCNHAVIFQLSTYLLISISINL